MAIGIAFLILLIAAPTVTAVQYVVGDEVGWNTLGDYTVWAAGKTFTVGDTLLFKYESNFHSVDQVSEADYQTCTTGNALNSYYEGQNTITLDKPGPIYFICPTPGHCYRMRLAIIVVCPTNTGPFVASPPTVPFFNSTPTVPAGSTPTVPASSTPIAPGPNKPSDIHSGAMGNQNPMTVGFSLLPGLILGFII